MKRIGMSVFIIGLIISLLLTAYTSSIAINFKTQFDTAINFAIAISPIIGWCLLAGTWDLIAEKVRKEKED